MPATVTDHPDERRYEIHADGRLAGFAEYRLRPGLVAFTHTEVDPAFAGQGLGSKLVAGALEDVRNRHLGVLPYCPFVRAYLERHHEHVDLVPADRREKFGL